MRPKGSAKELQVRRMIAGQQLLEGKGVREVARLVKASPSSVSRWQEELEGGSLEALEAKPHPGRRPRLTPEQKEDSKGNDPVSDEMGKKMGFDLAAVNDTMVLKVVQ